MVYVVQMLFILLCGYLFRDDKKKFLTAAFIALFILMAFRHARIVGNDSSSSYYMEFINVQKETLSWINPGLPFMMKAVHSFTNDYQWFIIVTAIWVCFAYYRLLLKYSEGAFISVMWFMGMLFYTFLFSALKQAWAMAFLCYAFDAIFEKKPFRFFLFVGLASLFHFPALIFLPAYFIGKLELNKLFPLIMAIVLVFVYLFRTTILNWMTSAYSKGDGNYSDDTRFIGTKFIFMLLILGYGFYQYYHSGVNNKTYVTLIYFMGIAAVLQTFCFYNNIFERLADYYYHYSILFMPLILLKSNSANEPRTEKRTVRDGESMNELLKRVGSYTINDFDINTIFATVITVFCVWRFVSFTGSGGDLLTPYYFFWQRISTLA